MTRSEVGRSQRTASRPAHAPPLAFRFRGAARWGIRNARLESGLRGDTRGRTRDARPSAIQAAAERTTSATRPADRAVVRLGLRTLVVAGFAGAAWLLSAHAAQAAEAPAVDPTTALSAIDLVSQQGSRALSDISRTPVTDAVTAAHQPVAGVLSESSTGAVAPDATSVVLPGTTVARSVPLAGAVRAVSPSAVLGLADAVAAPLAGAVAPATDRVSGAVRPVTGALHDAVAPVTAVVDALPGPVAGAVRPGATPAGDIVPRQRVAETPAADGPAVAASVRSRSGDSGAVPVHLARSKTGLRPAGVPVVRAGAGQAPGRPLPAPLRGYLGSGSGAPVTGPGAPPESGGYAVVSTQVAARPVGSHRLAGPAGVTVARQDAESPTVSPD